MTDCPVCGLPMEQHTREMERDCEAEYEACPVCGLSMKQHTREMEQDCEAEYEAMHPRGSACGPSCGYCGACN